MIYVSGLAKWALEKLGNNQLFFPGTFYDFFYETDDPHFFDKYTRRKSVFYPKDGGKFFETHEAYWKWINETGNRPWPDSDTIKDVSFMPVNKDGCPEYTIKYIADNFYNFHADWEKAEYNYSPIDKWKIRLQWGVNEGITDYISQRDEILSMRNAIAVLLSVVTGKATDEEKEKLASLWEKRGDISAIEQYALDDKRIQEIAETITKRHKEKDYV